MYGRRDRFLQLRQQALDRIDHLNRVGAGLALDRQTFRRLTLEPSVGTQVLNRILDGGDTAEPHRRPIAPGDDDGTETVGIEDLVVGVERDRLMRSFEDAL